MQRNAFPKKKPAGGSLEVRNKPCHHGNPWKPLDDATRQNVVAGDKPQTTRTKAIGRKPADGPRRAMHALTDTHTNARDRPLSSKPSRKYAQTATTLSRDNRSINHDQLWNELRQEKMSQYMKSTTSSRQRSGGGSITSRGTASETSKTSNDPKKAKLRDADFRRRVLLPRKISFPAARVSSDAFAHFGTALPSGGYDALEQMRHTNVWIRADDQLIDNTIREFTYMWNERLCEAEFASYATENLLRRDPRYPSYEENREWRVERMVELLVQPSTSAISLLRPPPATVSADSLEYDINFRPDLQYWLSVRSFNPEYVRLFSRYIYIHNDRITAPYFTVEYKKDGKSMDKAQDQIATAAATALYNRCLLKIERLKETRKCWTEKHTSSLRHYGLTLQGASYTFWCVRLKATPEPLSPHDWSWPGCDIVQATTGNMLTKPNVKHFIHWVNEIHRWGLSVHGPSCQKDVKFCIEGQEENVRTSLYASGLNPDSDEETDGDSHATSTNIGWSRNGVSRTS